MLAMNLNLTENVTQFGRPKFPATLQTNRIDPDLGLLSVVLDVNVGRLATVGIDPRVTRYRSSSGVSAAPAFLLG